MRWAKISLSKLDEQVPENWPRSSKQIEGENPEEFLTVQKTFGDYSITEKIGRYTYIRCCYCDGNGNRMDEVSNEELSLWEAEFNYVTISQEELTELKFANQ